MEDDELEKLREQKKQEIENQQEAQEQQQEQMENQIWSKASQYMSSEAKDRLSNIKMADKDKAMQVAHQIAMLGERGQIKNIGDDRMKQILKSVDQGNGNDSDIKFRR